MKVGNMNFKSIIEIYINKGVKDGNFRFFLFSTQERE